MSIASPSAESLTAVSATSAGKAFRLGRIFAGDGRTVVLPVDHGTMLGRVAGLEDPVAVLSRFLELACDGFLIGPGVAARTAALFARRDAPARLLTIDTYWRGPTGASHVLMTSLEQAAALGVDAVKVLMPWDVAPQERAARSELIGRVVSGAEPLGLPVMVEPICLSAPRPPDAAQIEADGCRMAVELGADIVKVMYPGDPEVFSTWCAELRVPVVILGGPSGGTADELCAMVAQAIGAGARGITIGRRIWQRPIDEAAELLTRLAGIVHRDHAG
ncbi:MAG: deoxyribose-phosphate aldolase [Solirubrobacteraceae bacterium]|jgi:class I fructose-bisphosphate aldolase